jgi:hypothetical protein
MCSRRELVKETAATANTYTYICIPEHNERLLTRIIVIIFFSSFFITIILCKRFLRACVRVRKRRQKCLLAWLFFHPLCIHVFVYTYIILVYSVSPMCGFHAWRNVRIFRNRLRATSGKHASNASICIGTQYYITIYTHF